MKKKNWLTYSVLAITLILAFSIAGIMLFNNHYSKELSEFKEKEFQSSLNGEISFEIPQELLANEAESILLKESNQIKFSIKEKDTKEINHMSIDATYNGKDYSYQSFSNEKTALLFNGTGWFSYEKKPVLTEVTISQIIRETLDNTSDFKNKFSKETIVFNNQELKTFTNEITLSDKAVSNIFNKYGLRIIETNKKEPSIKIYSINKNSHIVEFDISLEKETAYKESIVFNIKGSLYVDSTKKPDIQKPNISQAYDNDADFILDLILK